MPLFSAVQIETAQPLGPPDGRYIKRPATGEEPTHVLVFAGATLTVVDVSAPLTDAKAAAQWLKQAGEPELEAALDVVEWTMHAYRLITVDPHVLGPGRRQLLVARAGVGDGSEMSEGRLTDSKDLPAPKGPRFQRRTKTLAPQARMAAVLAGREQPLVCAELILRASFDFDCDRIREAALGMMVALNAAVSELSVDDHATDLAERTQELREMLPQVIAAAQTALSGPLSHEEEETVAHAIRRAEAAMRARAVLSS